MKAAAYAHSTTEKQGVGPQLEEIRQFIARRGWTLVTTYSDVTSAARDNGAGFRRLCADAARGSFDTVIVQSLDRAASSVKELVKTLEHLHRCRVAFVSIDDDIDTSAPAGEVIFRVMTAIGRFERALTGNRIRSGLQRAKVLGVQVGRPRAPVAPDQVVALRETGLSFRAIGRCLHISPALAHRLAREVSSAGRLERSQTSPGGLETETGLSVLEGALQDNRGRLANRGDSSR